LESTRFLIQLLILNYGGLEFLLKSDWFKTKMQTLSVFQRGLIPPRNISANQL